MVYGLALGPGDPELVTVKALRILNESDVIFYPGSLIKGEKKSFTYPILEYHGLTNKILKGFFLDMSLDRTFTNRVYDQTLTDISVFYHQGKKVAVVCEGDISLYASFSYLLERLKKHNIAVTLIPGINAFSLGAAQHQIPLSLLNDKIVILPREKDIKKLEAYLKAFQTVVLMKIKTIWTVLQDFLSQGNYDFYYCERLGTDTEFISTDLQTISTREIPYFSLLILKKPSEND